MNPGEMYGIIVELCWDHGGSVISGVRSTEHNEAVKGHPESRHLDGLAFDIRCDTRDDRDLLYANAYAKGFHGYKRGHLFMHLQDRAAPPP